MKTEGIIRAPNLPEGRVTLAAVGGVYYKRLAANFYRLGIRPAIIKGADFLPEGIKDHPDINLRHVGGRDILAFSGARLPRYTLESAGFRLETVRNPIKAGYKGEAALNAALVGNTAIHNFSITAPELKRALLDKGCNLAGTRQGYSACNAAAVDAKSIITSDAGLARAAQSAGLEALLIKAGFIELEGYAYGFIGGACAKLSKSTLAFTGSLGQHPDRDKIINFITRRGVTPVFLTNAPAFDAGGIIPLCEEL